MKVFGGYMVATRSDGARLTYPIAMVANDEGDALLKARDAVFEEWPVGAGYSNHGYGVVALPSARAIVMGDES